MILDNREQSTVEVLEISRKIHCFSRFLVTRKKAQALIFRTFIRNIFCKHLPKMVFMLFVMNKYTFPSEVQVKADWLCNRCFYFTMCGKHFPHPLLASTVGKTQSLIPKAYCPHFGLLWVWSFIAQRPTRVAFT